MRATERPATVRLPPRSNFEILLARAAQLSAILVGLILLVMALEAGRVLLAPLAMAVVIGLMLGPVAHFLERRGGLPPGLSAAAVVLVFVLIVLVIVGAIAAPLTFWVDRAPDMWRQLQEQLSQLREPLETMKSLRDQLRDVMGGSELTVAVDEGSPMESIATLAPSIIAQILIFFAGLYFFVATRHETRAAILRMCVSRRLRWRTAHIFRDCEKLVSTYLLSITVINFGLGIVVALCLWLAGVPSALLWGVLAGVMNYVIYIGPAVMSLVLFAVGLATYETFPASLVPLAIYLTINLAEAQFVTPLVIGRALTLNPFVVFLALAFWIWVWGPLGGFVAIPAMLIVYSIGRNILPGMDWTRPPREVL